MKFFSDAGFKALVGDAGSLSSQYSLNVLQRFLELGKQATYDENTRTWSLPAHVKQVANDLGYKARDICCNSTGTGRVSNCIRF